MFLPIGDTPNPRNFFPVINWLLIGANVLVYILVALPLELASPDLQSPEFQEYLQYLTQRFGPQAVAFAKSATAYDLFTFQHGFKPGAFSWPNLFSSMFLHGGFMHLAGNMLFLWIYGDNIEHRLGRLGYLFVYLGTGVAATLFFSLFASSSMTPLIGASGAISGVLGMYFIFFPRNRVKVFVALFPFYLDVVLIPARWVLGFFVIIDNLLPFLVGTSSNVAFGAHLGGFISGLGISYLLDRQNLLTGWLKPSPEKKSPQKSSPPPMVDNLADLEDAIDDGDASRALHIASTLGPGLTSQLPPLRLVRLAGWMTGAQAHPQAIAVLRRAQALHQTSPGDLAQIHLGLAKVRLSQGQDASAYQHLLTVLDLGPTLPSAAEARELLERIEVFRKRPR